MLAALFPEGILCVESALYHYGYSDFAPRRWSIALPRTFSSRRVRKTSLAITPYYIAPELHSLGKTEADFNGIRLPIYDRERTICDCFKYRTRMDSETFQKALNAYAKDPEINLHKLALYVDKLRLTASVYEMMGVLLHE